MVRKEKATKRELLSLVGLQQHSTKVVRPGRPFISRMHNIAARIKELHYYTTLSKAFKSDLRWWHFLLIVGMVSASLSVITRKPPFIVKLQQMPQAHGAVVSSLEITDFSMPGLPNGLQLV